MNFKVKGLVDNVISSGNHAKGPWFLYGIKETIGSGKTKTWRIFTSVPLNLSAGYELEGYISESPNKMYFNSAGKNAFQTTYNATISRPVEIFNQSQADLGSVDFGNEPTFNTNDDIPF